MILILSMDMEQSTDKVIDWLEYFNLPFVRINVTDIAQYDEEIMWSADSDTIKIGSNLIELKQIKIGWIRKFGYFSSLEMSKSLEKVNSYTLKRYLQNEISSLREIILKNDEIKWLCHPNAISVSKLKMLNEAKKLEIDIPKTYIVNNKKDLVKLFNDLNCKIIFKSIKDTTQIKLEETSYFSLTSVLTKEKISSLPEIFLPSLIQQEIEKDFEIRCFYLDGEFYNTAIFSQLDKQTKIDFRNYNFKRPNRMVPYILPEEIKRKLHQLMLNLNLNTGSLDIIKSINGKYYFLEVNPTGQFGMISKPCNFNLEQKVAISLKNKYKNYEVQTKF
ncbi:MAG: grasp-with-spasm system ATP-grasp peptide maturase [Ginsengibacter sp.]